MRHRSPPHRLAATVTLVAALLSPASLPAADDVARNPPPAPATPPPPSPGASGPAAELVAAKLIEEGEGDPKQALRAYLRIIRAHDLERPAVAEALFRAGEVSRRLGLTADARAYYQRVVREFQDLTELGTRSQAQLQELDAAGGDKDSGGGPPVYGMSPELRKRYGLEPSGPAAEPHPFKMSPELMKRYGLVPAGPGTGKHEGNPAFAWRYESGGTPPANPTAADIDPNTGMPTGGGLLQVDPNTGMPMSTPEPASGGEPGPTGMAPATARTPSAAVDAEELRTLLAERVEFRARRRQIERELRVLATSPDIDDLIERLADGMIKNQRLNRMLANHERLSNRIADPGAPLIGAQAESLQSQVKVSEEMIIDYIRRILPRHLEKMQVMLQQEEDRLAVEIDAIQFRLGSR